MQIQILEYFVAIQTMIIQQTKMIMIDYLFDIEEQNQKYIFVMAILLVTRLMKELVINMGRQELICVLGLIL